jgi:hypothetical protein
MIYSPTKETHTLWHAVEDISFRDWFSLNHELVHFGILDHTPAKEYARIHLAAAYACIAILEWDQVPDSQCTSIWHQFKDANYHLGYIVRNIALSEELLATAHSIEVALTSVSRGGRWEGKKSELNEIVEEALEVEEEMFPGFTALYQRFAPTLRVLWDSSPISGTLRSLAYPLMQPIVFTDNSGSGYSVPSQDNLEFLLSSYESERDVAALLSAIKVRATQVLKDWSTLFSVSVGYIQDTNTGERFDRDMCAQFLRQLWLLARPAALLDASDSLKAGKLMAEEIVDNFERGQIVLGGASAHFLVVSPKNNRRRDGVDVHLISSGRAQPSVHWSLAQYESLRQQILAHQGLVCPVQDTFRRRCTCKEPTRRDLSCLARRLSRLSTSDGSSFRDWSTACSGFPFRRLGR